MADDGFTRDEEKALFIGQAKLVLVRAQRDVRIDVDYVLRQAWLAHQLDEDRDGRAA